MQSFYRTVILCIVLCSFAFMLSSCSEFTVTMENGDPSNSDIRLTVNLPSSGNEADIVFSINGKAYQTVGFPTVKNPKFALAEKISEGYEDDGLQTITLALANDISGEAELYVETDDHEERYYYADMQDFENLLNFLKTN